MNFNNSTENEISDEITIIEAFQFYYTPVLVYLGIIGNSVSVLVFFKSKLNKLSSSFYLAALAISDSLFLLSLFVVWLNMVDVQFFNQQGICQLIIYLSGVCSFLSVWFVVAFTVERFIAVRYPLLRLQMCTVSRAKIVILSLTIIAFALFSPLLLFADVRYIHEKDVELCGNKPEWNYYANIFNIIDTVTTFVIPVILIIILNMCISHTVWKIGNIRRKLTNQKMKTSKPFYNRKNKLEDIQPKYNNPTYQNKVTKMLLMVSTTCLCLNLPSYIMRILTYLIEMKVIKSIDIKMFVTMQHCCLQIFNTNFGINFLIYCICGQNFRKALKSTIRLGRSTKNRSSTITESRTISTGSSLLTRQKSTINEDHELTVIK